MVPSLNVIAYLKSVQGDINMNLSFWGGFKACLPTILGYLSIGFAAGIVEKTSGLSPIEILLLSTLVYAGSAQFITAGLVASGTTVTAIIATIFLVNLRHLLLSAAIAPKFRKFSTLQNLLVGSLLTDETFGVASSLLSTRELPNSRWMHGLNLAAYLNWIVANEIGAFVGQRVPHSATLGLNFALPSMFAGLLILQLGHRGSDGTQKNFQLGLTVAILTALFVIAGSFVMNSNWNLMVTIILGSLVGMGVQTWKSAGKSSTSY